MKKVLLISYYFSPCSLTPTQRVSFWAQNLNKIGIYPIVVTRVWTSDVKSHMDTKVPQGDREIHEVHDGYEVYYLPFRPGILDRAYKKFGESKWRFIFLVFKILDVLLVSITLKLTSFHHLYTKARQIIRTESIDSLLISVDPFYLLKIGYLLNRQFKLPWVADYRDDWTTNELQKQKSSRIGRIIIHKFESIYEKKWVSSASRIISVSSRYVKKIQDLVNVEGVVVQNGFEENLMDYKSTLYEDLTLIYGGILYPIQNVSYLFHSLEKFKKNFPHQPFKLVFLGTGYDEKEILRIDSQVPPTIRENIEVTKRLPRNEALEVLRKAHALVAVSYTGIKGIPSSKLYEYVGLGKPILLCPTDKDVMEEIVRESGLGFIAHDNNSCYQQLLQIYQLYRDNKIDSFREKNIHSRLKYSRFKQMKKLEAVL